MAPSPPTSESGKGVQSYDLEDTPPTGRSSLGARYDALETGPSATAYAAVAAASAKETYSLENGDRSAEAETRLRSSLAARYDALDSGPSPEAHATVAAAYAKEAYAIEDHNDDAEPDAAGARKTSLGARFDALDSGPSPEAHAEVAACSAKETFAIGRAETMDEGDLGQSFNGLVDDYDALDKAPSRPKPDSPSLDELSSSAASPFRKELQVESGSCGSLRVTPSGHPYHLKLNLMHLAKGGVH